MMQDVLLVDRFKSIQRFFAICRLGVTDCDRKKKRMITNSIKRKSIYTKIQGRK